MCLCVCVLGGAGGGVDPSGVSGISLSQRSSSSWHPPLTSGMFPESLRRGDLWKDHVGPQGSSRATWQRCVPLGNEGIVSKDAEKSFHGSIASTGCEWKAWWVRGSRLLPFVS